MLIYVFQLFPNESCPIVSHWNLLLTTLPQLTQEQWKVCSQFLGLLVALAEMVEDVSSLKGQNNRIKCL